MLLDLVGRDVGFSVRAPVRDGIGGAGLGPLDLDAHPDADAWSRSAINLWLDARYDAARINTARTVIETELEALT